MRTKARHYYPPIKKCRGSTLTTTDSLVSVWSVYIFASFFLTVFFYRSNPRHTWTVYYIDGDFTSGTREKPTRG
jgi:hypothetical protein